MFRFINSALLLLILTTFSGLSAQTLLKISGQVVDEDTEEPQPFASVVIKNTTVGTSTDLDGYYTLNVELNTLKQSDTLVVSAVGYKAFKWKIYAQPLDQLFNIKLKSASYDIQEVVILAGENPANKIVRNIIKNKPYNSVKARAMYKVESYTKTELDLDNIDEDFKNKKVMRPFDFIFDNVDSTSDVKPFLPAYMTEELADVIYNRQVEQVKVMPKARKVSGVENETVIQFIGSMSHSYDIYDNWYTFLEKQFVSPFSNSGLSYYEYYIQDSTFIKGRWSYKLKFKPKRKQEPTFYGDFWVDMKSYAVEMVNSRMNPDVNINFVERIILYDECELVNDSIWLPSKNKQIIDFISTKKAPGVIGRKTVTWRGYELETPDLKSRYDKANPEAIDPATLLGKDEKFWQDSRHEELSQNEKAVYVMIDSIKSVPIYKTYVDAIKTITTGYKSFGYIEAGPYFSLVSNNPVEGWRFKLGAGTTNKLSKKIWVYTYLAYGSRDKQFKYGGNIQYNITQKPFSYIGGAYKNDIDLKNENSEEPSEDNLFAGVYRRPIPQKMLRVQEIKLFYQKQWFKGWTNRATILHRRINPYENIGFNSFPFRYISDPDQPQRYDSTFNTTEIIFRLRYAYKEKFLSGAFIQNSLGSRYPIVELQYSTGIKGVIGSQFNYHKLQLYLTHWFPVGQCGWMKYWFQTGKIWGKLPYLLLEVHDGNETYFYLRNSFNGMNRFEFVSDTWAQVIFEHHWDGFFLNHIPLLRKLKWREVTGFKAIYGTLSSANADANRLNNYDRNRSDYRQNHDPNEGVFYGSFDPHKGPYAEVSVGIENILKFIRIDGIWRLNYHDSRYAAPFTVRGTMAFYF